MNEIGRLRLKLIGCNMIMVTAAIFLTFRAVSPLNARFFPALPGVKRLLACFVIWLCFMVLSCVFSLWAVHPVKKCISAHKRFTADAAHELKTPLTIITANAGLLREQLSGISSDADQWLEHVNRECREMRFLIEDLLTLAKKDACPGNRKGFCLFSLSSLVTERILTFEPVFFQEEKLLEYCVEEQVLMKGNPNEIGQLVNALLDNALKYSVPRGRTQVLLEQAGWNKTRLLVNSQGDPIPKDRRALIFRRFYREGKAGGGPGPGGGMGGCGLGLAIAARTARNHRASIGVDYRDGMNCFCFTVRRGRDVF